MMELSVRSPGDRPASRRDMLVCLDSDGCVFDSMEPKQRGCFHPLIVGQWGLERIAPYVFETAAFVNLYSRYRGGNRFPSLLQTFDLLRKRPEVRAVGVTVPRLDALRRLIASSSFIDQNVIERAAAETGDTELAAVLNWSRSVNMCIEGLGDSMRPFSGVREALEAMRGEADLIVVSQTPVEALRREWRQHGLDGLVREIGGQEAGNKARQIRDAMRKGRYAADRVLVVGDALGDLDAARSAGAAFFPVLPGDEVASWRRLRMEVWPGFAKSSGPRQMDESLWEEFMRRLPTMPPWNETDALQDAERG